MNKIVTTEELVTPAIAEYYLSRNINNRPLRASVVNVYADQMQRGLWRNSNDAICLTSSGNLINGQHRLSAVCKSGCSVIMNVSHGYDDEDILVMDNGVTRTAGDFFRINNITNYNNVASICKKRIMLGNHNTSLNSGGRIKIMNVDIEQEYSKHSEFYDKVVNKARECYTKLRVINISDIGGITAHLVLDLHHNESLPIEFFLEVCDKKPATNSVVTLLRTKLINDRMSKSKLTGFVKQKLIIKAWNAYITGKTMKILPYNEVFDKDLWFI